MNTPQNEPVESNELSPEVQVQKRSVEISESEVMRILKAIDQSE